MPTPSALSRAQKQLPTGDKKTMTCRTITLPNSGRRQTITKSRQTNKSNTHGYDHAAADRHKTPAPAKDVMRLCLMGCHHLSQDAKQSYIALHTFRKLCGSHLGALCAPVKVALQLPPHQNTLSVGPPGSTAWHQPGTSPLRPLYSCQP